MSGLKHGTIREVFSRILYDPFIDPSEVEIVFQDSDLFRCVLFTFIEPSVDGFYYRGNFYPFHKIIAIRDVRSGRYFLRRRPVSFRMVGDLGIEVPDFPVYLRAVYDDFLLYRYSPFVLASVESRMRERPGQIFDWFKALGSYVLFSLDGVRFCMIREPGPFRGTILVLGRKGLRLLKSIPTPYPLFRAKDRIGINRAVVQECHGVLYHYFIVDDRCFCSVDMSRIEMCVGDMFCDFVRDNGNTSLFILKKDGENYLLAVCDQSEFRFMKIREEKRIAAFLGISIAPVKIDNVRVRDIGAIPNDTLIKIYDYDVIFSAQSEPKRS